MKLIALVFCFLIIQIYNSYSFDKITVAAERTAEYLPLLKNKNIAVVANQTSLIGKTHLVDSLVSLKIIVKKIFCPEHGFRGKSEAGEEVQDFIDKKTGIPIVSLYGKKKKPSREDLFGIDIVVFDIQDVGVRFYTYISTLTNVMESCAESGIQFIVFDRPNPNGFYIDGPVLDTAFRSFVGFHQVPIVYGMTIGEYAKMVNGERWLKNGLQCNLMVILCEEYSHSKYYELPEKPSPNLVDMKSVYLYPSICLFEGTSMSVGRGTIFPFQVVGNPDFKNVNFSFVPIGDSIQKIHPLYENQTCFGYDFRKFYDYSLQNKKINISWLINTYEEMDIGEKFFIAYFDKLAGNSVLRQQIMNHEPESAIRESWKNDLENFKKIRKKYLLYSDF